jgi:hypothetical protein
MINIVIKGNIMQELKIKFSEYTPLRMVEKPLVSVKLNGHWLHTPEEPLKISVTHEETYDVSGILRFPEGSDIHDKINKLEIQFVNHGLFGATADYILSVDNIKTQINEHPEHEVMVVLPKFGFVFKDIGSVPHTRLRYVIGIGETYDPLWPSWGEPVKWFTMDNGNYLLLGYDEFGNVMMQPDELWRSEMVMSEVDYTEMPEFFIRKADYPSLTDAGLIINFCN